MNMFKLAAGFCFVGAGIAVAAFGSGFVAQTLFQIVLFIMLAIGWNIISGFTGYVSFGQVSFFGLGAYITSIVALQFNVPWYVGLAAAGVIAPVMALPLGLIMLRLSGIYFALGMFGLARILQLIASELEITGGPMGTSIPIADSPQLAAVVCVSATTLVVLLTYALYRSRLGLSLMAIRDDPVAAESIGINTFKAKIIAFCISAAVGGIGGALYVWNIGFVDPASAFSGTIELQCVLIVLAGGIGTAFGPVIGGLIISSFSTYLWLNFPLEQQAILGIVTMFVAIVTPGGVAGLFANSKLWKRQSLWRPIEAGATLSNVTPFRASGQDRKPILTCQSISVHFGGVRAVNSVDVTAYRGEMLAIIGPNGAGKSTLFNLMSSFLKPTAGRVELNGISIVGKKAYTLPHQGLVRTFQTSRLFSSLSVWENILVAANSRYGKKAEAIAAATKALVDVDLLSHWQDSVDQLTPGQQRLLEIARSLVFEPEVLLLDEAMAGMTMHEIGRVHQALKRLMSRGAAVVAIEHVLPAIAPLAARVHVLDFGTTVAEGIPAEVMRNPLVVEAYMGREDAESEKQHA
ncbi:ATP-binding cassette domain-containing protein [Bradyrhizobium sp. dw_78]|uniref:branched-chain amino acid ABC transporter ATP-binding protein/permease n=1 Tax=Bradyrhizobium sp. dw_78 TaxID=2719793 RepID=UPI001BD5C85C|nr:ATP-binding cassette domain-containing protein [Bradyrhizobium sp. dw_78]